MIMLLEIPEYIFDVFGFKDNKITDRKRLYEELNDFVKSELDSELHRSDRLRLSEIYNVVFGCENAEKVKNTAEAWNDDIRSIAYDALSAMAKYGKALPLDTEETYALRAAAYALDNEFFAMAKRMVVVENESGFTYMRPHLPAQMEEEILNTPEKFCALEVNIC